MSGSGSRSSQGSISATSIHGSDHPAWAHCTKLGDSTQKTQCNYCSKKLMSGGITRMNEHLIAKRGEVASCNMIPKAVRDSLKFASAHFITARHQKKQAEQWQPIEVDGEEDEDEMDDQGPIPQFMRTEYEGVAPGRCSIDLGKSSGGRNMLGRASGRRLSVDGGSGSRGSGSSRVLSDRQLSQKTLRECYPSVGVDYVNDRLANMMYENAIPFNVANSESYKECFTAVANYGRGYNPPTAYQLSHPLLKKQVKRIKSEVIDKHRIQWEQHGCTLMADGWKDQRGQKLINFLVYGAQGSIVYLKSICIETNRTTAEYLFRILSRVIEDIGPKNVVQVITDQEASFKAAGTMIRSKYNHIYWSACAAHVCDLILGDLEKAFSFVKDIILHARIITSFIYAHTWTLMIFRKYSNGRELLRPCATRFATSIIALRSVIDNIDHLKIFFLSSDWKKHPLHRDSKEKKAEEYALSNTFYKKAKMVLAMGEPIMKVLRLVDSDNPTTSVLYEAFAKMKQVIAASLLWKESHYLPVWKVIDKRWSEQLHNDLHAAAHELNPRYLWNPEEKMDILKYGISNKQLKLQAYECIQDILQDGGAAGAAITEMSLFHTQTVLTSRSASQAASTNAASWWLTFGSRYPSLQKIAVRILGQTTTSSGCERNWSTFDQIHTKKRNKITTERLNDLVFVHYNSRLERRSKSNKYKLQKSDPLSIDNYLLVQPLDDWLYCPEDPEIAPEDLEELETQAEATEEDEPEVQANVEQEYQQEPVFQLPTEWASNIPEVEPLDDNCFNFDAAYNPYATFNPYTYQPTYGTAGEPSETGQGSTSQSTYWGQPSYPYDPNYHP